MFAFRSIIVVTTQFLSPALHKNFSEADFDFKVCVWTAGGPPHHEDTNYVMLIHNSVSEY